MIEIGKILEELDQLNKVANRKGHCYELTNDADAYLRLYEVSNEENPELVFITADSELFYAYVSLLKNIFIQTANK